MSAFGPVPGRASQNAVRVITEAALEAAQAYNFKRYQYQGIRPAYERDRGLRPGGSRTLPTWRTSFLRAVSCLGPSQAAVTRHLRFFIANIYFTNRHAIERNFLLSWQTSWHIAGDPDRGSTGFPNARLCIILSKRPSAAYWSGAVSHLGEVPCPSSCRLSRSLLYGLRGRFGSCRGFFAGAMGDSPPWFAWLVWPS